MLFAAALGIRLVRRPAGGLPAALGLAGLALLIYLTHPFSLMVLLVMLAVLSPFFAQRGRRLLWIAAAVAPALLVLIIWWTRHEPRPGIIRFPAGFKLEYLLRTPVMLLENPDNALLYVALVFATALAGVAVIMWIRMHPVGTRLDALKPGRWTTLAGIFVFTVLYFAAPFSIGATVWLDLRLAVFLWVFAFLAWGHHLTAGWIGKALTVGLCLVALLGVGRMHRDFSREIDPLFTVLEKAEPNRRILPITLEPISDVIQPFYFRDRVIPFCTPYAHFGSYYHVAKGGQSPWMTFWGGLQWVPLRLKDPLYVNSFRTTDLFQPMRLMQILPEVAPSFDYLLLRGGDTEAFAWIERVAVRRAQAGPFHLFEVRAP